MKCPFCTKSNTQVLESRPTEDGAGVRRRRECKKCGKRFTTVERVKGSVLWVIKKDGNREVFEREKLKKGILRAIEKRPVSLDLVEDVVSEIERKLLNQEKEEIPTKLIGNLVLEKLKKIDKVAWLRFASVYLEFEDVSDFEKAINRVS